MLHLIVKDGVVIASKFLGMAMICVILATLPIVVGIIVQTLKGYFNYNISAYLIDSYLITLPDYLQICSRQILMQLQTSPSIILRQVCLR